MDLAELFTKTVTVESQTGSDKWGKPNFATKRTISCAIRQVDRRVVSVDGIAVVPTDVLLTDQQILTGDRYWPPGADTTDEQQARTFGTVRTQDGLGGDVTLYEVDLP